MILPTDDGIGPKVLKDAQRSGIPNDVSTRQNLTPTASESPDIIESGASRTKVKKDWSKNLAIKA